mgnify:CR=1 FL=1
MLMYIEVKLLKAAYDDCKRLKYILLEVIIFLFAVDLPTDTDNLKKQ